MRFLGLGRNTETTVSHSNTCMKRVKTMGRVLAVLLILSCPVFYTHGQASESGTPLSYFAQFAVGGGFTTFFTIHSTSTEETTVSIDLFLSDGSVLWHLDLQLLAGATETVIPDVDVASVMSGWARIISTGRFTATEFFEFRNQAGQLVSAVGVLPSTTTDQMTLFVLIQSQNQTNVGVALANPSEFETSELTVRLFNTDGELIGTRVIQPGP